MAANNRPRSQQQQPQPPKKQPFRLRRIEMIGLALMGVAILLYMFSKCGGKTPPSPAATANNSPDTTLAALPTSRLRPLYVVIDSLKLRPRPQLDSSFTRYLIHGEEVYDLGEQTATTQTIRYSADEVRTEPWVKIKTKKGEVGWVFGAGVSFYRKKKRLTSPAAAPAISDSARAATTATRPSATTTATGNPSAPRPNNR